MTYQQKESEIRQEINELIKGFVRFKMISTTVLMVGGLLTYWHFIEASGISHAPVKYHLIGLIFLGILYQVGGHFLFNFYFKDNYQNSNKKPLWLIELDRLAQKVTDLSHELTLLKSRSNPALPEALEKSYILLRERDFNDELESKISYIESKIRSVNSASGGNCESQLTEIRADLQEILRFIEINREYLFVAA